MSGEGAPRYCRTLANFVRNDDRRARARTVSDHATNVTELRGKRTPRFLVVTDDDLESERRHRQAKVPPFPIRDKYFVIDRLTQDKYTC